MMYDLATRKSAKAKDVRLLGSGTRRYSIEPSPSRSISMLTSGSSGIAAVRQVPSTATPKYTAASSKAPPETPRLVAAPTARRSTWGTSAGLSSSRAPSSKAVATGTGWLLAPTIGTTLSPSDAQKGPASAWRLASARTLPWKGTRASSPAVLAATSQPSASLRCARGAVTWPPSPSKTPVVAPVTGSGAGSPSWAGSTTISKVMAPLMLCAGTVMDVGSTVIVTPGRGCTRSTVRS